MLLAALAIAILAASWNVAESQSTATPEYPEASKHNPTTLPDRVALTFEGDPASEQSVTWRTDTTVAQAQAQIALAGEGPGFKSGASTVQAYRNLPVRANLGYDAVFHTVRFTDLEPDTKYLYRVGDGTNWTEWYEFMTASDKAEPFSFVYYGDAQNDIQEHWSRVTRQAFKDAPETRLFVHAGDLVNTPNFDQEWGEWFTGAGWIGGMVPSFATPGNHEYSGSTLSPYWRTQFAFPNNGPQGTGPIYDALKGTAFYTDYQGVRFISLNSNTAAVSSSLRQQFVDVQRDWLEDVLENNPSKWTVATFHHPIFSNEPARNNPVQRASWMPVLERYGVDLVLQGHDHSYGRGNLATGQSVQSPTGTIYVVSVSGPKMYGADDSNWVENGAAVKKILTDTQLYQVVSVQGNKLRYQAKTATGRLHDAFTIKKDGATKSITEWDESALGSPGIGTKVDTFSGNVAQAFRTSAQATGVVDRLNVYLENETTATKLVAGIYADDNGRPGRLLATGTNEADGLAKSAWNTVLLPSLDVSKDTRYWIALLGTGGKLSIRDECCGASGSEPSETSRSRALTELPQTWQRGTVYPTDGPVSAFAPITGG